MKKYFLCPKEEMRYKNSAKFAQLEDELVQVMMKLSETPFPPNAAQLRQTVNLLLWILKTKD